MEELTRKPDPEDDTGEVIAMGADEKGGFVLIKMHVSQRLVKVRPNDQGHFPLESMTRQ